MRQNKTWAPIVVSCLGFLLPIGGACSASDSTGGGARAGNGGDDGGSQGGSSAGGATGGTGTGASGGAGGTFNIDASGGSGGSGGVRDACAGSSYRGEQIPLDMYIMFDQSGSMRDQCCNNSNRWDAVKNALITFVESPDSADVGIGIQYFPLGAPQVTCVSNNNPPGCFCVCFGGLCLFCVYNAGGSCEPNDYATPDVPIQPLPGVAPDIVASLNAHSPGGGTPTHPALQGAMQYAISYATQNPGRKTIVVLATDGAPNDCSSNVTNVAQAAAAGYANNPSVQTFVIGVGDTGNLNQIAQAGGTNQALVVSGANAGQEFLDAMNQIRGTALSCDFSIPLPDNQEPDFNALNVLHKPNGATEGDIIYKVNSEAECSATLGGWYYDDPNDPKNIRLCPVSCDLVKSTPGQVDIEVGCPPVILPPE